MWIGTLEHRFDVLEYLKGSAPGTELVAIVIEGDHRRATEALAAEDGKALLAGRDARWDGREAVVFLTGNDPWLPDLSEAGRFRLGAIRSTLGFYSDFYSIGSLFDKAWLPLSSSGGATGASGERRYLLDVPASGASGQSDATPTITLAALKAEIAAIESVVAAGGGTDAYRDCLYTKYRKVRETDSYDGPGDYYYLRYDEAIESGQPAETLVHTELQLGLREPSQMAPNWGEYRIIGRDHALFVADQRMAVTTARPLPAGVYKFNPFGISQDEIICDAVPEKEKKRIETFVTVTAPSGTVHEAFFDPATIGTAVGADGTNGALTPTAFTVGGVSTALQSLKWESGTATLELSPAASLTGHALDLIALDGSVALSLDGGAATVSGGTLTWSVADQPWQAGDLLMFRIRTGAATPIATPTATPAPSTAPSFGSSTYAFSVAENAASGAAVGTVAATVADDGAVTYSVTAGNDAGAFAIDSASGAITIAGSLDHESTSSYSLTVAATDGDGETGSATVAVTVTNVNEPPVFDPDSHSFTLAETASVWTILGTVAATDEDGDTVTHYITAGDGDRTFNIDLHDGLILLRKALDYETTTSYTLTVEARDGNGGVDTATVTITVTDVEGS